MVDPDTMVEAARRGAALGARRLGIVTAGRAVEREEEIEALEEGIARIVQEGLVMPCASLGLSSRPVLERLAAAGLARYHHNIETAPSHYPSVCSTRRPEDSFRTVEDARRAGLEVCCGGIVGLGETPAQRVEFLETVRDLNPDSVPLNFYLPVPGARIRPPEDLTPEACLRIVAVARLMMPGKEIRLCAGREQYFGREQERMFRAGADGMMVGDYLTLKGRPSDEDRALLRRAGMEAE
jgi:biotin synthase